jgi:hypothetical protein
MKLYILLFAALFAASCTSQKASTNQFAVADLIEAQKYTFVAQSASPTEDVRYNPRLMFRNGANLYQLSGSGYDLKITKDSVIAYLPYFGRSYTAPMNPNEGGIKFTSTDFSYKKSIRKKNYEIEIKLNDNREVNTLFLTISPNGYSFLRISLANKTPIAFNGRIEND